MRDAYPVNQGHFLLVLKRHEPSLLEITKWEWDNLYEAVHSARETLQGELHAEQFNIGANIGEAAGQTIPHLHVHIIPRYAGDRDNLRGGVQKGEAAVNRQLTSKVARPLGCNRACRE